MPILPQVETDAVHLRNLILNLREIRATQKSTVFEANEEAFELHLINERESLGLELIRLEDILETKVVPEEYISIITKEKYYPAADELVRTPDYYKGILKQVRQDFAYLQSYLNGFVAGKYFFQRPPTLPFPLRFKDKLQELTLILTTATVPDKYRSLTTQETYYPSPDEDLAKKPKPLLSAKYTMFSTKQSRTEPELPNSIFKIVDTDGSPLTTFFMEHKEDKTYPHGGFAAKVKKGYPTKDSTEPKYAIKIYRENIFSGNSLHQLRIAMRASYCYKQLGREGFVFRRNDKQYMVTEWLNGCTLGCANQERIQLMPIPLRIVMAISLLRELRVLHKQGLIHNDIKPENVIINYGRLNFVDLDSVRPKNERSLHAKVPMHTDSYLPNYQMSYDAKYNPDELYLKFNEKTDIYAMGMTLAHLFPEIYKVKPKIVQTRSLDPSITKHTFYTFYLDPGMKYAAHPALGMLLDQMVSQKETDKIIIDKLIEAFQQILSTYPDYQQYLKEDKLPDLGSELSIKDGEKAFEAIEKELLEYNLRCECVGGLRI